MTSPYDTTPPTTGPGGRRRAVTVGLVVGSILAVGGIVVAVVVGVSAPSIAESLGPVPPGSVPAGSAPAGDPGVSDGPANPYADSTPGPSSVPPVSPSAVAEQITTQTRGRAVGVICPDALPAAPGAGVTCAATVDGEPVEFRATVTAVGGSTVFDIALVG